MSFDPYAYAESTSAPAAGTSAPAKTFDPYAYASGNAQPKATKQATPPGMTEEDLAKGIKSGYEYTKGGLEGAANAITGMVRAPLGAAAGLVAIPLHAMGAIKQEPADVQKSWEDFLAFDPADAKAKSAEQGAGKALSYLSPGKYKDIAENIAAKAPAGQDTSLGAGFQSRFGIPVPGVTADNPEGVVKVNPDEQAETSNVLNYAALPFLTPKGKAAAQSAKATSNAAPKVEPISKVEPINLEPTKTTKAPEPEEQTPAQNKQATEDRQAILQRVGVTSARQSALENNRFDAAVDYQTTKAKNEDASQAADEQFQHEKNALVNTTGNLVKDVGGTLGMDQRSILQRGKAIDAPFNSLSQWFTQREKELYSAAQEKSDQLAEHGNPGAYTSLESVDKLLNDPTFQNTLLAKNQQGLLGSIQSQLKVFKQNNPNGFTPAAAEQVRQWLNQIWSPDNRGPIKQIKSAIDNDVMQTAGDDFYTAARNMHTLKNQTLDNPKWSNLFDKDPFTPQNRPVPFEKIPDKLSSLSVDQITDLMDTLKNKMPGPLQEQANSALGHIKGHFVNQLLETGSETRSGNPRELWDADGVNNFLDNNSATLEAIFKEDLKAMKTINDIRDAGNILKVDSRYPGAAAQSLQLTKRGIGAYLTKRGMQATGAAIGSSFGPGGAGAGVMAGEFLGEGAAAKMAAKQTLNAWKKRVKDIGPK